MNQVCDAHTGRVATPALVLLLACCLSLPSRARADDGKAIIEHSGCTACHRVDEKLVGPSFKDIATRYRGKQDAAEQLFDVVRNGSDDPVWGRLPMPMTPPEKISDADLKQALDFILGL